jgi:hypothetical protein
MPTKLDYKAIAEKPEKHPWLTEQVNVPLWSQLDERSDAELTAKDPEVQYRRHMTAADSAEKFRQDLLSLAKDHKAPGVKSSEAVAKFRVAQAANKGYKGPTSAKQDAIKARAGTQSPRQLNKYAAKK